MPTRYKVIVRYTGSPSCWTRSRNGKESEGARLDREMFKPLFPATLATIEQAAADYEWGQHPLDHVHWGVMKGYLAFDTDRRS